MWAIIKVDNKNLNLLKNDFFLNLERGKVLYTKDSTQKIFKIKFN